MWHFTVRGKKHKGQQGRQPTVLSLVFFSPKCKMPHASAPSGPRSVLFSSLSESMLQQKLSKGSPTALQDAKGQNESIYFSWKGCTYSALLYFSSLKSASLFYFFSLLRVSDVPFRHPVEGLRTHRFLSSDLGGFWLLWDVVLTSLIFVFVQAGWRHGFCPPTAFFYFSLRVSEVSFQHPVQGLRTHRFWRA